MDALEIVMTVLVEEAQAQSLRESEDIMDVCERADVDVDAIPDCDSREDFIDLNQLARIHNLFEEGEYLYE